MMHHRCTNENYDHYEEYGGRGISVDPSWNQFENFLKDMGPRPEGTTLDRIDNDGNYEASNCRWASSKEQSDNKRSTLYFTLNGVTKTLTEWGAYFNIGRDVLYNYMYRHNNFNLAWVLDYLKIDYSGVMPWD